MDRIEFHTDPMSGEIKYKFAGESVIREMTEVDTEIIDFILEKSRLYYPEQFEAVTKKYEKRSLNKRHYDFIRARRIINCGFGENDRVFDVDEFGHFNFEPVKCPLIAECKYYKVICQPRFESDLSERELEVMKLFHENNTPEDIAEKLFLSIHTVKNHKRNALNRLRLHSLTEFISYASINKLFSHE